MPLEIALLHDAHAATGPPDASDTLLEAEAIAAALRGLGYRTTTIPVGLDLGALERTLKAQQPHAIGGLVGGYVGGIVDQRRGPKTVITWSVVAASACARDVMRIASA